MVALWLLATLLGIVESVEVEATLGLVPEVESAIGGHVAVDGPGDVDLELGEIPAQNAVGLLPGDVAARLEEEAGAARVSPDQLAA